MSNNIGKRSADGVTRRTTSSSTKKLIDDIDIKRTAVGPQNRSADGVTRKQKKRLRIKKKPVIILVLILFIIFCGIHFYTHSKKYLFLKGLEKSYSDIMKVSSTFIDNYMPYINNDYVNNTNSVIKILTSEIDSKIHFNGDIYLNNSSNYFDLIIDANKAKYDLEMLSLNNKLHFKVDDSDFYYSELNNINFSNENYFHLLEMFVNTFKDNVKNSNLKKESAKVVVNSKNLNAEKITMHIDNNLYKKIVRSFYNNIKDDDVLLDMLVLLNGYADKKELIKFFEGDDISLSNDIYISVYLYKSSSIKIECTYGSDQSISTIVYDDCFEIYLGIEKSVSYIKFNNGKINLFLEGIAYGIGSYDDNFFEINFTDYSNKPIGNISYSINKNKNKYSNEFVINFDLSGFDIKVNSSNEIEVNKTIPNINVNDSIVVDNMKKNDKETLSELLTAINIIFAF